MAALMTPHQRTEIERLVRRIYGTEASSKMEQIRHDLPRPTLEDANALIVQLTREGKAKKAGRGVADIPAGRYALTLDGKVCTYQVDRPERGRWKGYTFIKELPGEEPVKGESAKRISGLIAQDCDAAARLYGRTTGVCGICGRTLTSEDSVEAGIGPVCAAKVR